jgi:hypothetical protein
MRSKKNVLYSFVNPEAKLLKCNRSFLSISGVNSISEIIGKEIKEVFQFFSLTRSVMPSIVVWLILNKRSPLK